ncbi:MAG: Uma2 family endonuclease [Cyclobacteriaceae bacterium]|nr:Uma2 family endonuclease [Cyclobacteriaceae bacterium]
MRKNFEIESPPRTIMQVYQSLPEGTLAELIDNVLYMSPSPIYKHQKVLRQLFRVLCDFIIDTNRGEVMISPFDVYLDETSNAVQPDLVVVLKDNLAILNEEGHIHGVPDLLIEILSPGNTQHDTVRKKNLYEKFGVKEYWIVDPDSKRASVFQLQNQAYQLHYEGLGQIESPLLNLTLQF